MLTWPWTRQTEAARVQREAMAAFERRADLAVAAITENLTSQAAQDMAGEDASWRRIGDGMTSRDFSAADLRDMRSKCRALWSCDPTLKQVGNLLQSGTFGRGISTPRAADKRVQQVVDRLWSDTDNLLHAFSHDAQRMLNLALLLDGETFHTLHTTPIDARIKIGELDCDEIAAIITHPEDRLRPVLYQRKWRPLVWDTVAGGWRASTEERTAYYLDWRYSDEAKAQSGQQDDPEDEAVSQLRAMAEAAVYVVHTRVNTTGLRGVPEAWAAYDWSKAHHRALSDLATWTKAAAMLAWRVKMQTKSSEAVSKAAAMFREPVPGTAGVHVSNDRVDVEAIDQPSGGGQMAQSARELHLQSIRAFGFGEHWYSNGDNGNLATASAMELPAMWRIDERQETVEELYLTFCRFAVSRSMAMSDPVSIPEKVDPSIDLDFPSSSPRNENVLSQLLEALSNVAGAGLIDPQEAAYQAYLAIGSNDIEALLERQFPPETKLDGDDAQAVAPDPDGKDVQAVDEPATVTEAGDGDPFVDYGSWK